MKMLRWVYGTMGIRLDSIRNGVFRDKLGIEGLRSEEGIVLVLAGNSYLGMFQTYVMRVVSLVSLIYSFSYQCPISYRRASSLRCAF